MKITAAELEIINKLGEVFNLFCKLPEEHPMAKAEFCSGIHVLQNDVAARATFRFINSKTIAPDAPSE